MDKALWFGKSGSNRQHFSWLSKGQPKLFFMTNEKLSSFNMEGPQSMKYDSDDDVLIGSLNLELKLYHTSFGDLCLYV